MVEISAQKRGVEKAIGLTISQRKNFENKLFAELAQLVEQRFRKAWVIGSIPMLGSSFKTPRGFTARGVLVVRNLLVREATLKFLAQLKARDLFADLSAEEMEASSDIQRFE